MILNIDPVSSLQAATKQYVDKSIVKMEKIEILGTNPNVSKNQTSRTLTFKNIEPKVVIFTEFNGSETVNIILSDYKNSVEIPTYNTITFTRNGKVVTITSQPGSTVAYPVLNFSGEKYIVLGIEL